MYKVKALINDIDQKLNDKAIPIYYNRLVNTSLKLIRSGEYCKEGQCFNYATKNYNICNCQDCLDYIKLRYNKIDIIDIKINDVVVFFDGFDDNVADEPSEYNVNHYGIIIYTDNTISGTIIRSKWGTTGIFEGRLNDIPDIYGDRVCFYRKKE